MRLLKKILIPQNHRKSVASFLF